MNKYAPFILVLLSMFFGTAKAQDWKYDFEEATALAKEKNQNIVLLFTGSDWCPPCIKLERKIFSDPKFKDFADENFIWVKADFPKRKKNRLSEVQQEKNMQLAERYNKRMVFPVILVINNEGKVLGATGYRKMSAKRYMELLTTFNSFGG
ncbi:thioredoxin family protein [Aquimarina sp. 2201CG14-23]|uniref:thioredoxin family protein n=1 Tax=Aquimarina mycalae TaxID=3040073 RepID=UPI00247817BE|nr:thioredoxin family protein [Aquimarina sp. 2201CG14-23]MDH7445684.1 thioredoxin family protein [Aquimarina sp. 2201CG14-23]